MWEESGENMRRGLLGCAVHAWYILPFVYMYFMLLCLSKRRSKAVGRWVFDSRYITLNQCTRINLVFPLYPVTAH